MTVAPVGNTQSAGGRDPSAAIPANIMRVKETVIDEEELIKQRGERKGERERERLINQQKTPPLPPPPSTLFFFLPDVYLEAHYAVPL